MDTWVSVILIGIGATALMDLWGILRTHLLGISPLSYGLVGRWLLYMPKGRFRHTAIAASSPVEGELILGWVVHYAIGIGFASLLVALGGAEWLQQPSLGLALTIGIGTLAAPFLLMQPAMGAGIAASKTPNPSAARLQSLITHTLFGLGLYGSALGINLLA